jgi:hypothetical protein
LIDLLIEKKVQASGDAFIPPRELQYEEKVLNHSIFGGIHLPGSEYPLTLSNPDQNKENYSFALTICGVP